MNTTPLSQLLVREMNRKEFLLYVAAVFLALTGISGLIKIVSNPHNNQRGSKPSTGFGSGPYGV